MAQPAHRRPQEKALHATKKTSDFAMQILRVLVLVPGSIACSHKIIQRTSFGGDQCWFLS
jgi:hypothetical protein